MTSVFGTDSAYYGIANNHLYLNITDDFNPQANSYYSSMQTKGASDEDTTAYQKYTDKWNPSIFAAIKQYDNSCKNNLSRIAPSLNKTTIYSVMEKIPSLKGCLDLVKASSYGSTLNEGKKTFFAFENTDIAHMFLDKYNHQVYVIRELLKANTLNFPVNPSQLVKRKVKLTTMSDSNYLYADGRGKQLVIYIPNSQFNYYNMPKQDITILVKGYVETDNGWLYILDVPIIPQIIL